MSDEAVGDLVKKINRTGTELFLYYGSVVARPDKKLPSALHAEVVRRIKEIKSYLVAQLTEARSAPGATHKWVLRLGDAKRSNGIARPAYLACGPQDWCMRMIRQSQELSDPTNKYERSRWMILEQDQVGAPIRDERGVLIATVVALPDGVSLGGPPGSPAEIVSACPSCLEPQITDERVAEIVKNDD